MIEFDTIPATAIAVMLFILSPAFWIAGYRRIRFVAFLNAAAIGFILVGLISQNIAWAIAGAIILAVFTLTISIFRVFIAGTLPGIFILLMLAGNHHVPVSAFFFPAILTGVAAIYFHREVIIVGTAAVGGLGLSAGILLLTGNGNAGFDVTAPLLLLTFLFGSIGALYQFGYLHPYLGWQYNAPQNPLSEFEEDTFTASGTPSNASKMRRAEAKRNVSTSAGLIPLPIKLVQVNGRHANTTHPVYGRKQGNNVYVATIGRPASESQVEVPISEPAISRNHAQLILHGKTLQIRNLSGTNPTLINNIPIGPGQTRQLRINDVVTLADIKLSLTT